jgi:hypothetical protein
LRKATFARTTFVRSGPEREGGKREEREREREREEREREREREERREREKEMALLATFPDLT